MKLDIADSFEKRIKSRFSHRQVLLYGLNLKIFKHNLRELIKGLQEEILAETDDLENDPDMEAFSDLENIIQSGICEELI